MGSGLFWHYSWEDSEEGWFHRITLCTCATVYDDTTNQPIKEIDAQEYNMHADDSTESIVPETSNDGQGIYPNGDGGPLPDWAEPFLNELLSGIFPGIGWAMATDEAMEAFENPDGVEIGDGGFSVRESPSTWFERPWEHIGHFHEAFIQSGGSPVAPSTVESTVEHTSGEEKTVEYDINISDDDVEPPDCPPGSPCPVDIDLDILERRPNEWPEKYIEKFGVKKVASNTTMKVGEKEMRPDYILTKSPFEATARSPE